MAQLTGPARRSTSHIPVAFVAGTLFALAATATVVILALALGVNVGLRGGAAAAQPGPLAPNAVVPVAGTIDLAAEPGEFRLAPGNLQPIGVAPRTSVTTYDGRIDPIEVAYIRASHAGAIAAPRTGFTTYDNSIDPMEQAYIDGAHRGSDVVVVEPARLQSELPRYRHTPR